MAHYITMDGIVAVGVVLFAGSGIFLLLFARSYVDWTIKQLQSPRQVPGQRIIGGLLLLISLALVWVLIRGDAP